MIKIKIDAFEGPLDLLLHLIDKAEVDIYEISVSEITDQYVAYIRQMQDLQLEVAGEYLVMAASLLSMKSRMLLPKPELDDPLIEMEDEELDPREALIQRLIQYKKFKHTAEHLRDKATERNQIYTRPAEDLSVFIEQEESNPVEDVSLFDLLDALQKVIVKNKEEPLSKVERDEISIDEKMTNIRQLLRLKRTLSFSELFDGVQTRQHIVVTFLSLLELMKKKEIMCVQNKLFDEIIITFTAEEEENGVSTTNDT